jgi:NhaP-type Na+/H+ or K+/H+ antiporter
MTVGLFLLAVVVVAVVGIALGAAVAPFLTRVSDRLASDGSQEDAGRDDGRA